MSGGRINGAVRLRLAVAGIWGLRSIRQAWSQPGYPSIEVGERYVFLSLSTVEWVILYQSTTIIAIIGGKRILP